MNSDPGKLGFTMTFHNLPACESVVDKVPDVSHGTAQFREATSGMIGVKTV